LLFVKIKSFSLVYQSIKIGVPLVIPNSHSRWVTWPPKHAFGCFVQGPVQLAPQKQC